MQSLIATKVTIPDQTDLDYGEGWLEFEWLDSRFGREGLTIQLDGHCSRFMPIRSGCGLRDVQLSRDRILLSFEHSLAEKLELDDQVEIVFQISDSDFSQLQQTVATYFA